MLSNGDVGFPVRKVTVTPKTMGTVFLVAQIFLLNSVYGFQSRSECQFFRPERRTQERQSSFSTLDEGKTSWEKQERAELSPDNDLISNKDKFPPPEVFFPSPDFVDATNSSDGKDAGIKLEHQPRKKKRLAIQRMHRRYFPKVSASEKRRGRKRLAVRRFRRKIWELFQNRMGKMSIPKEPKLSVHTNQWVNIEPKQPLESETLKTEHLLGVADTSSDEMLTQPECDETVSSSSENQTVEELSTGVTNEEKVENDSIAKTATPIGERWAIASPDVDLSGKWELIVTEDFKTQYDRYLEGLGQPKLVRSVALSAPVIGKTMEELIQIDCGQSLLIRGKNIRGTWDRTLVASGANRYESDYEPLVVPIRTVDGEQVESEAWWEENGTVHISWMRGVTMYGGGSFFNKRYLEKDPETNETIYVAESAFIFNDSNKEDNVLTWKFRRMKD